MRKIFIICLLSFLSTVSFGKEIFISKPGKEDGKSCQAVHIKDAWFLTSAHCVVDICNTSCEVTMQVGQDLIVTSQKNVYSFNEKRGNNATYDIALINFQDAKIFDNFKEPKLLIVDNKINFTEPQILNRSYLNVLFNLGNSAGGKTSQNEIFYGPKSKIIFTDDFGLFHGISGSGVFTNKGELVAITSAVAGKGSNIHFSVFSAFDKRVENFLKRHIPLLNSEYFSPSDFKSIDNLKYDKETLISLDNDKSI